MKTRRISLYGDLYPGWQDPTEPCVFFNTTPMAQKPEGALRVKITVELPCIGGRADTDIALTGETEIVPPPPSAP